jgi:hypothetical protein
MNAIADGGSRASGSKAKRRRPSDTGHMPTPPTEPTEPVASAPKGKKADSPATEVGSSNWRSVVLRQAQRLTDELGAMPQNAIEQAPPALMNQARDRIAAARAIAEDSSRSWATLRNWWTGNAVETAWDHLQTAREIMLGFAPSGNVRAQLPSLLRRLVAVSPDPAHDPQVDAMKATLGSTGDLSADQRSTITAVHEHVRFAEDDHSEARGFRNNLLLWTVGLAIGAGVLALIAQHGGRYLVIGAVAGMLTTALAWRSLTHLTGPFSVNTAQALLKIAAGAASALLGVLLVRSGIISGLTVNSSSADGYALVFGLSQQALTQVVDNAAKKLGGA